MTPARVLWASLVVLAGLVYHAAALRLHGGVVRAPTLIHNGDLPARGRVLWFDGEVTARGGNSVALRDSADRVFIADERLHVRQLTLPGEIGSVVNAAPGTDGTAWIVDGTGRLLHVTADGHVVTQLVTRFRLPILGDVGDDGTLVLVRSPRGFPFVFDTAPAAPIAVVDTFGRTIRTYGVATRPAHILLTDLANAGYVAREGMQTFFAPFVRDEVVAFGERGDTLWTLRRGLSQETPEPRFELREHRPVLDYFPVNLGIALGPDSRLYVLSTADSMLRRSRLDVLDPGSGQSLAMFFLPTIFPTIIVTPQGVIHVASDSILLARAKSAERPLVPSFAWRGLNGDSVTDVALHGRVTIVNAWASWCAPCREEMPELVALWMSLRDSGVALLTINEDRHREDARRWLAAERLVPPVALAGGEARQLLHYPGLPYTILVDRNGRIARRWIGFAGPEQIADVAAAVRRELGLQPPHANRTGPHHHRP